MTSAPPFASRRRAHGALWRLRSWCFRPFREDTCARLGFDAAIQTRSVKEVSVPCALHKTSLFHELQHARRLGKASDGCGKVLVCCALARDPTANDRQNTVEVEVVERAT